MLEIRFIEEIDNGDGTINFTYEATQEVIDILTEKFGEPLDEKLSEYIINNYKEIFDL